MVNQGEDVDGISEQVSQLCLCSDLSASSWACLLVREIPGKSEKLGSEER